MKICKPFKEANPQSITQGFGLNPNPIQPNGHTGNDFGGKYGTFLVAPCKVQITNIIDNLDLDINSDEEVRKGFGIAMRPLEGPPDTFFLYWHCLPIFPVKINDIVEQGMPVAQMGNSGYVMWGGQYVPVSDRNNEPHKGTHVHFEYFIGSPIEGRKYLDVLPLIDWTIPVGGGVLEAIQAILSKMINLFK